MTMAEAEKRYAVVIGGMNVDVAGLSGADFRMHDSNPGSIRLSAGGVGQNIARNLAMLGIPTYMVSVCSDDAFGRFALEDCRNAGLLMEHTTIIPNASTSTYLYVNDNRGDLVAAVNDMNILKALTPELLEEKLDFLCHAACCVIDANLTEETIRWIGAHVTAPICADTTSIAKCKKLLPILDRLFILKANDLEAVTLVGNETDPVTQDDAAAAAKMLSQTEGGAEKVFVSLGANGMMYASSARNELGCVPTIKTEIVSTNGAGDCAMAAIIRSYIVYGDDISGRDAALASQAAASINLESPYSFSPELTAENLEKKLQKFKNT